MTDTDSRRWPEGFDALFPDVTEDRLALDEAVLDRLAALLDMDPAEVSVTVRSLVREHGGDVSAFEMRNNTWRIDLPVAIAKSVLVGVVATSVLQLLGADAVPVAVAAVVAPLVFEIRRVELRPSDAVIHARLSLVADGDAHRLDELYGTLPADVRAELSLMEFADVVERLLRARLAVVGPDGLRLRARDTGRGFRLLLSDPRLPPDLLFGPENGEGTAEPRAARPEQPASASSDGPASARAPRVFVSYAHDSPEHKENVRAFCEFLVANSIDVEADVWNLDKRRDWPLWAIREIPKADFVIVVASPECRRVGDGEVESHERRGLQSEMRVLRELLNADVGVWTEKILPVVLPGGLVSDIPLFLQPTGGDHHLVAGFDTTGAEEILRRLTNQPPYVRPALGPRPDLPPHPPAVPKGQHAVPQAAIDASRRMCADARRKAATAIVPRAALEDRHLPRIQRRIASSHVLPVPLLGEAGIGKSVLSAQIFQALDEDQDVTALLVNCEYAVAALHSQAELDRALGALLAPASTEPVPLTAVAAACAGHGGRQVVLVLDTVDYLLNAETAPSVLGLLHTLYAQEVLVVLTCRQHDFDTWLAPGYARLAASRAEDMGVPPLTRKEVVLVVRGYLESHGLQDTRRDFVGRIVTAYDDPDQSALRELIANPLHLFMFCELFAGADSFPPDLSATRLMRRYFREKVTASRRYPRTTEESFAKQRLVSALSRLLWAASRDTLSLWTPENSLPLDGIGLPAYQDLLSETVLVQRESLAGEQVGFRHQALTEYFIAMYLHQSRTERNALLEELGEHPHERWFAWQMVRHLVAMADAEDVEDLLGRLDLDQIVAFRSVVFGAVEEHRKGLLLALAEHVHQAGEVFGKQLIAALPSVPDSGLEEAVQTAARLLQEVPAGQVCAVARSAARLVVRGGEQTGPWLVTLLEGLRSRMSDPSSTLEHMLVGDVMKYLLAPFVERGRALPPHALSVARDILRPQEFGAPAVRELARAFLIPGTPHDERVLMLVSILARGSYRELRPVDEELVLQVVPWAQGATTGLPKLDDPLVFLTTGRKQSTSVRYAALARAANEKPAIAALLTGAFLTTDDNGAAHHMLLCLQQAVRTGGAAWVAEALQAAPMPERSAGIRQVCGVLTAFAEAPQPIRIALAEWFEEQITDWSRTAVDAYLRLVHDDPGLLSRALDKLTELSASEQERTIANLARDGDGIAKDIVLTILSVTRTNAGGPSLPLSPAIEARLYGLVAESEPYARERLVELVTGNSRNASDQALHQLEGAADRSRAWLYAELLTPLASCHGPLIRRRALGIVVPLVRTHQPQAADVVLTWLDEAARRAAEGIGDAEELRLLLQLANNFCYDEAASVVTAEDAIIGLLERATRYTAPAGTPVVRQLVALLKTLCVLHDHRLRLRAAGWLFRTLRQVDVKLHKDATAWAREALGRLVEAGVLDLGQVIDECAAWIPDNQLVTVELVMSHDVRRAASPHLDTLLRRGCSAAVAERIVAYRHPAD
ncbi:NACHT domain-containing protein [Streptomyces sp. NBC_00696]|uniref:NACHT domain-containing protein n=1 Tax=Streptomyces sp. NBC_00696 TaxID=2903672 RepID=UPI002E3108AA|nr:SEFIR domain-containing protein [Streptomyces sp. NBC_00696]